MQVLLNLQMPVMQCKNAQINGSKLDPNIMKVKLYNDKCMVSILGWMSVCLVCIFASISLYVFTFLNEFFFFSRANQSDCTSYCQGEDVGFHPSPPHHQSSRVSSSLSLFLSQASLLGKRVALGMRSFFQNMAPILQPTCFLLHDLDWPVFQSSLITHLWVCAGITGYLSSHVPCFLRGKKCSNIILYFPFLL